MASYDCARKVLQQLAEEEKLRRIMCGIYEKPQYNEFEYIAPFARQCCSHHYPHFRVDDCALWQ